uniref:Uncharacterized protein n=1 Tax=Mola mola TaxID=94237 RepID=A0A3Q3WZ96_MOLML
MVFITKYLNLVTSYQHLSNKSEHLVPHTCDSPHSSRPFLEDPSLVLALSLFTCDSAMSALSSASSSSCCSLRSLAMLLTLQLSDASLQFLELFLAALHGDLLGFIQAVLQVFDCLLHVLLHALQMGAGVTFHLFLDSQSLIAHPLVVPLRLLHFLIFFSQLALHVSLHLVELQLCSEDLALFVFKRTFCLLQCRLKLGFLLLELLPDLLQLMSTSATLTKLVGKVRNLLLEVLVLSLHRLKLI